MGCELANELFDMILEKLPKGSSQYLEEYRQDRDKLKETCDNIREEHLVKKRNEYITQRMNGCYCAPDDYHMLLKPTKLAVIDVGRNKKVVVWLFDIYHLYVFFNHEPEIFLLEFCTQKNYIIGQKQLPKPLQRPACLCSVFPILLRVKYISQEMVSDGSMQFVQIKSCLTIKVRFPLNMNIGLLQFQM